MMKVSKKFGEFITKFIGDIKNYYLKDMGEVFFQQNAESINNFIYGYVYELVRMFRDGKRTHIFKFYKNDYRMLKKYFEFPNDVSSDATCYVK